MKTIEKSVVEKLDHEITHVVKTGVVRKSAGATVKISHSDFFKDKLMMIKVIREGVPYSLFTIIQAYTPFTDKDWSNFLDISTKSLLRYKQSTKNFKPIHSEKIIEMAEVTNIGLDVFGSMEKFKLWLETPNFSLGNIKPMDLLRDSYGKELVISELTRINYGILV
ncbi:antitoxin Xre/MbcA/ParS toxin-binding domain-containing protein [Flavobacterium sp.]|jgi:putative toxin-antitoxin system antitoxin component (TIGR02293 family)|uniref:type II RES/Xre toxin-antitoxin system antitoxin n=1 Tax=Flavobacterium sp. TaxID=239 RepID=UPI0037BE509E